jgi:UDP-glucuronate decarboxylase
MIKVLVTGGAGNVGGALARKLAEDGKYQVVIIDNLITGNRSKLPGEHLHSWKFYKADVNDYNTLAPIMRNHRFDFVFHYAALVGVERTLANPVKVLQDLNGLRNICELCVETGVKRVFFSSSSEVYGEPLAYPQNEATTPLNATLPYAKVKSIGESFFSAYHQQHGLDYTVFRFFNTYGPLQSDDFVLAKFVRTALKGQDITVIGDGSQTRTFCYIDDNIYLTMQCLEKGYFRNEILNLGNDNEISIRKLAELVVTTLGSSSHIVYLPAREEGDMTRRLPDLSKLRRVIPMNFVDLETGILKVVEGILTENGATLVSP